MARVSTVVRMMMPEEALVRARTLGLGALEELGSRAVVTFSCHSLAGSHIPEFVRVPLMPGSGSLVVSRGWIFFSGPSIQ